MERLTLERHQVWIYLGAIVVGLLLGGLLPALAGPASLLLWPSLALLLFAAFVQVPLKEIGRAFRDHRFVVALVLGNFVCLPLLVWSFLFWLPANPALHLGVLLVLLVPCTDWFITFSQLGKADLPRAMAVTPINLLLQLLLLPLYLWIFMGDWPEVVLGEVFGVGQLWPALLVILLPLLAAYLAELWMQRHPSRAVLRERLAWWPVPLLAWVIMLVAAIQVQQVFGVLSWLGWLLLVFLLFLLLAALLAKVLSAFYKLSAEQGRTLAFSFGTRNSFVVLPLALSLPPGWELVAMVIVVQSLVELFGMSFYLWWVPRRLFP